MIHSFEVINCANGNTNVLFYQGSKKRTIIFQSGTEAQTVFKSYCPSDGHDCLTIKESIDFMRSDYYFKANVNNKSVFRPIDKALILNA